MTGSNSHRFGKVAVLFGGTSSERKVSLMSGEGVLNALRSAGVDAHAFDPAERPLQALKDEGFERVFIALHGRGGEDGTLQGALECLGIPYTGSGVKASAIAMDKVTTKQIWLHEALSTPAYARLSSELRGDALANELATLPARLGLPFIMKPPHEGSSIGFSKIESAEQSQQGFELAAKQDTAVLAEAFIAGKELTVTILGGGAGGAARALPIIEIRAPKGNYDFQNKYYTDVTKYLCPAPLLDPLTKQIQALCIKAYNAVGCEGWGRVDVMLRETIGADGQSKFEPFLLEVNTSPGMTSHSLVPMAAKAVGISYEDLCIEILATASLKTLRGKHVE
jgi:D-alanine-D-alanine ligase